MKIRVTKKRVIVLIILIFFGLIIVFLNPLIDLFKSEFFTMRGTNESYEQAQRFDLVRRYIPPNARKINYDLWEFRYYIEASFEINEEDFISWAKQKEWPLKEVSSGHILAKIPSSDPRERIPVTTYTGDILYAVAKINAGFYYRSDGGGIQFIYDKNNGMGYFWRIN